ncbi:hypothetical protein [Streptomyces sp. NBC_01445]|uniref:hypothetical protein n=1 Tax=Streptomyces sp. NBC_01445 TaxID=2903869 RepID=UPI002DD84E59|nr:hypothetical protein [Streptomyces sp. NBC_01445]WSE04990.1 hypothetical protein OG574_17480 [Streptomyces sp. NBC_01445]
MNITADTTTGTSAHTDAVAGTAPAEQPRTGARDADGMAVASFVLGLLGLLVLNLFLGPIAIVLAGLALMRGTARRGRALLGLGLGIADLAVLAAFVATDHTLSWSLTG